MNPIVGTGLRAGLVSVLAGVRAGLPGVLPGLRAGLSSARANARTRARSVRASPLWTRAGDRARLGLRRIRETSRRPGRRRVLLVVGGVAGLVFAALAGEAAIRARLGPMEARIRSTAVYGRPFGFERGVRPDRRAVEEHLRRLGYRPAEGRRVERGTYALRGDRWTIGRRPFREAPELAPAGALTVRLDYRGRVDRLEAEDGTRLSRAQLEPELLARVGPGAAEDRRPVPLSEMPPALVQAVLQVEDQRFRDHHGLDVRRIAAALLVNVRAGEVVQGGSTLTQQLAKNLYLSPERSLARKVREAFMAVALELRYPKDRILEAYLNEIYLGRDGVRAIHGVGAAARAFFGKDVSDLDLAESALLAGVIRAPNAYTPLRHPEAARERRDLALRLMREAGGITEQELAEASARPVRSPERAERLGGTGYFVDWAVPKDRARPGGSVVTTLEPTLQLAAERAVREGLERLERDFPWLRAAEAGEPLQAALVALDPRTGDVLAMVGGRDYRTSPFNRAAEARRQPGSAFKPVVALAALARRPDAQAPTFTLASRVEDEPLRVETPAGPWEPTNYSRRYEGSVTLREALERSLNVPFARIGLEVGGERIVETARRLGIESPLDPYPALALGAYEVTPLELTRAYAVLAAGGVRAPLRSTLLEVARDGSMTDAETPASERVYDASEAYLVTSALRGVVDHGTGRTVRSRGFRGDVAAKSGTTNDFRDAWFVGYTPTLAVGVWVGFDRGRSLQIPGAGAALPIFEDFLERSVGSSGREGAWGSDGFDVPDGLEQARVGDEADRRGWRCGGEPEWFLAGTAPEGPCGDGWRLRRTDDLDRELEELIERGGPEARRLLREFLQRVWRGGRSGGR